MMICLKSITFMSFHCGVKALFKCVCLCVCVCARACLFAATCAFLFISQYESVSTEQFSHSKANPKTTPSPGDAVIYLRGSCCICRACFKH